MCVQFHCSENGTSANNSPSPGWIRDLIQFRYMSLSQDDVWEGEGLKEAIVLLMCHEMYLSVGHVMIANTGHSFCWTGTARCFEYQILWLQVL